MTLHFNRTRSFILYGIASLLLLLPLVAMQFTSEVNWSAFDFLVGGVLLFGTATAINLVLSISKPGYKKWIFVGIILLVLLLVWAELAVGLFGSPWAGS